MKIGLSPSTKHTKLAKIPEIAKIPVFGINLVCLGEGYKPIFINNGPEIRIQHAKNIENSLCEN
jgi:hypothetical protein